MEPNPTLCVLKAEETYFLRREALLKNIPQRSVQFEGDLDLETLHWGLMQNNTLIGALSLMRFDENGKAVKGMRQLRGMAIHPEHQGQGFGSILLKAALEKAIKLGEQKIWCNARVRACKFYQKQGFEPFGETFEVPYTGPHYRMRKVLLDK